MAPSSPGSGRPSNRAREWSRRAGFSRSPAASAGPRPRSAAKSGRCPCASRSRGGPCGSRACRPASRPTGLPASCVWDAREAVHRAPAVDYAGVVLALARPRRRGRRRGAALRDARAGAGGQARALPLPDRGARGVAAAPPSRRGGAADRRGQDLRGDAGHPLAAAQHAGRGADARSAEPVVRRARRGVRRARRHRRRRLPRRARPHGHHLRLGVPAHGPPGRPLRPGGVRRVPPPARAPSYAIAARMCLAPFRLGLTATPERTDGRDGARRRAGRARSSTARTSPSCPASTWRRTRPCASRSRSRPRSARPTRRSARLPAASSAPTASAWASPTAGPTFLMLSSQSDAGRRAFAAYRRQRGLALAAPAKLDVLERLLHAAPRRPHHRLHRGQRDRVRHLAPLPRPGHHPPDQDQASAARSSPPSAGDATAPSSPPRCSTRASTSPRPTWPSCSRARARCASTCSASGASSARPRASAPLLYELVAAGTSEERTSEKRREHVAYR